MILTLRTRGHRTLEEVRRFLSGNESVDFVLSDRLSAYSFIVETLVKRALPRRDKGSIRACLNNALVESRNGNVIRRHFGYRHIPKLFAREVNAFARDTLSPFLDFHRPCLFATDVVDPKGRIRKRYP